MTLPAFASEHRAAGRLPLSIDISRQQQQTRRKVLQRANGTDRRTDGWTDTIL